LPGSPMMLRVAFKHAAIPLSVSAGRKEEFNPTLFGRSPQSLAAPSRDRFLGRFCGSRLFSTSESLPYGGISSVYLNVKCCEDEKHVNAAGGRGNINR
ncbi:hypothetical protein XENORESO_012388, partial [Xenotaenia resolanae]